ncbi:hypothetical protein F4Z99_12275 [Candidatus Poribacteria bacterium]|nr:hypothetical protein [Candidatus Poribacteria bacterium]MYB02567.1 hypothetical protein [Candidatus Poribacteria bacterium]
MFDNSTNQTPDYINTDPQQPLDASDSVVKTSQKPWNLPTLERALLTVTGFLAYFLAFRFGRTLVEWQFGLTIILSTVLAITVPALYVENKRLTNQLSDGHFCIFCYIGSIGLAGLTMLPVFFAWIGGTITYKLIAPLVLFVILFPSILYLENERVSSQLSEEVTEPRTFRHALAFVALAIIVGGIGWIVGTGTHMFIEIAVPKVTLL